MIEPVVLKGFRDSLPKDEIPKKKIIRKLEDVFTSFGFSPIYTTVLEYTDVLRGKGGGETEKQMSAMQSRLRQSGPDWKEAKLQQDIGGTKALRRQQSCWRRSLCKDLWWRFFTVS